jgi:hypothetical protein
MLRNPIDFLISYHNHCVFKKIQKIQNINKALKESCKNSKNASKFTKIPFLLNYKEILSFEKYINNYLRVFPRHQVQFVFFEDFKKKPKETLALIQQFLKIKEKKGIKIKAKNAGKRQKIFFIHSILENPTLKKIFFKLTPPFLRHSFFEFLLKISSSPKTGKGERKNNNYEIKGNALQKTLNKNYRKLQEKFRS